MKKTLLMSLLIFTMMVPSFIPAVEAEEAKWTDRITISGAVEGDLAYSDISDPEDKDSDSESDLFIGTVELGVEVEISGWLTGSVVFLKEDIGTVDETDMEFDEALLTFEKKGFPVYAVFGKRAQPFGVFENHLVADPMTQDAYETNRPGLTLGVTGPMELDVSATVYRGEEMMNHLVEAGLSSAIARDATHEETQSIDSYLLSVSVRPLSGKLALFASYISEPGFEDRNNTLSLGVSSRPVDKLTVDAEYFMALQREEYDGQTEEFQEKVVSATVAYQVTDLLGVALRYEKFDDDGMSDETNGWSVNDRYGIGGTYVLYGDDEAGVEAFAALEYRKTSYEVSSGMPDNADEINEIMARLGVSF